MLVDTLASEMILTAVQGLPCTVTLCPRCAVESVEQEVKETQQYLPLSRNDYLI